MRVALRRSIDWPDSDRSGGVDSTLPLWQTDQIPAKSTAGVQGWVGLSALDLREALVDGFLIPSAGAVVLKGPASAPR
jgi:hypothetical protein